jgi:fatty acid synthase
MMQHDIASGIIAPLNSTVFDARDIVKAFQHMSTGSHTGKVLVRVRAHATDAATLPINVQPRFYCNPEHSYVIVGGLGGLGLEFCQWLIGRQCRKLVLSSSRGISSQYQAFKIK